MDCFYRDGWSSSAQIHKGLFQFFDPVIRLHRFPNIHCFPLHFLDPTFLIPGKPFVFFGHSRKEAGTIQEEISI